MRKSHLCVALLLTLAQAATLCAQDHANCPVQMSQNSVLRQGSIWITVQNPPRETEGTVHLRGPRNLDSAALPVQDGTLEYAIPDNLPLGKYAVTLTLGQLNFAPCEPLRVVPALNWEPKLTALDPEATYSTETVRLPDEKGVRVHLKTVRLALRGSGFIGDPPEDNQIVLNGETQQVTWKWDNDKGLPDPATPAPNVIHGRVINPERIELYRVPVPSGGVLRVALLQGDKLTDPLHFTVYRWSASQVAAASAAIALVLALTVLALIRIFIKAQPRESDYNALQVLFLDAETDSYSLSKFQFYCWTVAALFGYSYLVISKILVQGLSWPDIPVGLPSIIAIGAGTSVGAQVVTNLRGPKGSGSERPSLGDLVTSGGVAAADRVQMLVWTLLGVTIFCVSVLKHDPGAIQDLDPVPAGMLSIMGLSAAGYLGGKFARKPGPIINEISITPAVSDDAIGAAARLPAAPPDLSPPVARAMGVAKSLGPAPAGAEAALNALNEAIGWAAKSKTSADAEALPAILNQLQSQAEVAARTAADAFIKPGAPAQAARGAEVSQQAAAALQDLSAAISSIVSLTLSATAQGTAAPHFVRVIELRGRTLSPDALLEIDGEQLAFRMLRSSKAAEPGQAEVVLREQDNPDMARVLRLPIDPWQLEGPDLELYKGWFGTSDTTRKKTFTIINPDGQKSDIGFTVPPAAGQSAVKTGQDAADEAPAPGQGGVTGE